MIIREIHGVAGIARVESADTMQSIAITDFGKYVRIEFGQSPSAGDLSPKQARWLAQQLISAAARIEKANKTKETQT